MVKKFLIVLAVLSIAFASYQLIADSTDTATFGWDSTNSNYVLRANSSNDIVPGTDDSCDLGSSSLEFSDIYIDGIAYMDAISGVGTISAVTGTLTGTVSAEQLTSTDDALITDDLLVGGDVTVTGSITSLAGTVGFFKGADVASATTITLGEGNYFDITGTTAITSVATKTAGMFVILQFDAIATFTDGSNLKLAGDLVSTADDTITLVSDGTSWFEVSRSVN